MNIAKMAIQLSANAAPLVKALGQAAAGVQSWANRTVSAVSSAVSAVASKVASLAKSLAMAGLVGGAVAAVGGGALFVALRQGVNDLVEADRAARRLGMSLTEMRAAKAWGGGADVSGVVGSVQGRLADAGTGGFAAGQDLAQLAAMSGSGGRAGSFGDVVDQLARIEAPAQRAAMAFRLMGDGAADVLHALNGPNGMQEARSLVERMGMGANAGEMETIRAVAKTMRDLEMIAQGVFNQIILGLAPVARAFTEAFSPANLDLSRIKGMVLEIGIGVGYFGAWCIEASRNGELLWQGFDAGIQIAKAGILQLKAAALEALHDIALGMAPVWTKWAMMTVVTNDPSGMMTKAMLSALPGRDGIDDARKAAAEAAAEARKMLDGLGAKMAGTGAGKAMEEIARRARELANATGDTAANLTKALPAIGHLAKEFERMQQGTAGPGDAFRQTLGKIGAMWDVGMFQGQEGMLAMQFAKAGQDLISGTGVGQYRAAGAALGNTREAYSAIAQAERVQRDPAQLIKAALDADAQRQEMQIQIGRDIEAAVRANKIDIKKKGI